MIKRVKFFFKCTATIIPVTAQGKACIHYLLEKNTQKNNEHKGNSHKGVPRNLENHHKFSNKQSKCNCFLGKGSMQVSLKISIHSVIFM